MMQLPSELVCKLVILDPPSYWTADGFDETVSSWDEDSIDWGTTVALQWDRSR